MRVQLFGTFSMEDEQSARITGGPADSRLTSYLFSFPNQAHRREKILDRFWNDSPEYAARAALSRMSWRIRRRLSPHASSGIHLRGNQDEIWLELPDTSIVDAHCFQREVNEVLKSGPDAINLQALDRAVSLYTGPFLEEYAEDWVLVQRERLQSLYLRSLTVLMATCAKKKRIGDAITCGRAILTCDPTRETVQRIVMILYVINSQRGEAIRQFDRCRRALREECDVDPAPETCSLLSLIRSGEIYGHLNTSLDREFALSAEEDSPLSWQAR